MLKPDIVHSHGCLSARIAARISHSAIYGTLGDITERIKTRTPYPRPLIFYTRHSVFEPSGFAKSPIGRLIGSIMSKTFSDGIIAVANAAKDNLVSTGVNPDRVTVIYNGVEPIPPQTPERAKETVDNLKLPPYHNIVIAARLNPVKGHRYFIDAAKILAAKGIRANYLIAGTGSEEQNLKSYAAESNAPDTLRFLGFVKDIPSLLNITTIQVNASYGTEAASLSLLEGMSLGIPAVVTDYGGNPELIDGTNGIVVPQKNAAALADAITKLLRDKE